MMMQKSNNPADSDHRIELPARDIVLEPPESFLSSLADMNIVLEHEETQMLGRFLAILLHVNAQFNLTAVREADVAWQRHIADSLTLLPILVSAEAKQVIDVGSGGGMPGIPLATCLPEIEFTLLEATGKKARFLVRAVEDLQLKNVRVIHERAEVVGQDHKGLRASFDVAIARAVGPMPILLELTVPLVRIGGFVLAVKGERAEREVQEARQSLHLLHSLVTDILPTPTGNVVIVEKQRKTPRIYPRRPGEPKRAPLGGKINQ